MEEKSKFWGKIELTTFVVKPDGRKRLNNEMACDKIFLGFNLHSKKFTTLWVK